MASRDSPDAAQNNHSGRRSPQRSNGEAAHVAFSSPKARTTRRAPAFEIGRARYHRSRPSSLDAARLRATERSQARRCAAVSLADHREALTRWWLAVRKRANTPNWDIVSTATIDGIEGLVLVEAKAHAAEIKAVGKLREGRAENHARINAACRGASAALNSVLPVGWSLGSQVIINSATVSHGHGRSPLWVCPSSSFISDFSAPRKW